MTYRHSDGYPSGALADLVRFFKWNKGRNTQFDYVVPNWFYLMKKDHEQYISSWYDRNERDAMKKLYQEDYTNEKFANNGNLSVKLGYGLMAENSLQLDLEYIYTVDIVELEGHDDNTEKAEIVIKAYEISNWEDKFDLQEYFEKYGNRKLVQTVKLDVNGKLIENTIKPKFDKDDSNYVFRPQQIDILPAPAVEVKE